MADFDSYLDLFTDPDAIRVKLLSMNAETMGKIFERFEKKKKVIDEFDSLDYQIKDRVSIRQKLIDINTDQLDSVFQDLKRQLYLINKYGQEDGERIHNGEYWIGMSEEQVIDAKGKPTKVETEVMKTKTKRILIYGNKSSGDIFTIVNGEVERFKDR